MASEKPVVVQSFDAGMVYALKKIVGTNIFSVQFSQIISHYKNTGYNIIVLGQTECLMVNPITFNKFAFLLNCTLVGQTSNSLTLPT